MDLFEIIFIALFILFPIMEGILKQRKKGQQTPPDESEEVESGWSTSDGPDEVEADRFEPAEERKAAEMLPDDLWELMTGERRGTVAGEGSGESAEPWSVGAEASSSADGMAATSEEEWRSEPVVDDEATAPEPVSMEYEGPEAYSLETPAPEPIERTVPSAKARHRAFHDLVDRPRPKRTRRTSPVVRSLRSSEGLRQAVLLREILGPPKGME